jgi:inosine/xanthosine triphosphate pyrophosphatase family protein
MHPLGIKLNQEVLGLDEIQAESSEKIASKKAAAAFKIVGKPLFVNDASWHIPALGGFPGPFMKYIVKWLTEDDILNLMRDKADRTIILNDVIVYTDGKIEKLFMHEVKGAILSTPQGPDNGPFVTRLVSLTNDGKSLASVRPSGFTEREFPLWNEFSVWLKTHYDIMNQ